MTIEIDATLQRKGSVFLMGEEVRTKITFKNLHREARKSLAWGCIQLHCEENATSMLENEKKNNQSSSSTAVTKSRQAIYSSDPVILFCDLTIGPGKHEIFESANRIPLFDAPPSFKGHYIKYFWYVSVAAQRVDAPIKMIKLPLKVLNVGIDVDEQKVPIRNPFIRKETSSPSMIEIAMSRIEEMCSIRKKRIYEMNNAGTIFAKIILHKNIFKLGDDVFGKLEFPQEDVHCLQTLIRAEAVETNLQDGQKSENIQVNGSEHIVTAIAKETYFKMSLPLTAVPAFTTEYVKLRWRLHFEFVTTRQPLIKLADEPGTLKLAEDLQIETMKWDLPINILTCNPFNASLVSSIPSTTSIVV